MAAPAQKATRPEGVSQGLLYADLVRLIERLHRRFLDVVKAELSHLGIEDINAPQALLVTDLEDELAVGDLVRRAYHLGSSVSYNIKRLREAGYIEQERSAHDRRSVRLRLSDKGRALAEQVRAIEAAHGAALLAGSETRRRVAEAAEILGRLERAWSDRVQFGQLRSL